jgi:hypothetical protein
MVAQNVSYPSLGAFYQADRRRRPSRETDFGLWWRADGVLGVRYRAAHVHDTGELYVMQHEGLPGGGQVIVVGAFGSIDEVAELLAGWQEVNGDLGSLRWLVERLPEPVAPALLQAVGARPLLGAAA